MKRSELKLLIKECIVEIANNPTRRGANKVSNLFKEALIREGGNLNPAAAFSSFKKAMDSDVHDGLKYPWSKYGKALTNAVTSLAKEVQVSKNDMEELYMNLAAGDEISNSEITKSKYFKQIKNEFDKFSLIWEDMCEKAGF